MNTPNSFQTVINYFKHKGWSFQTDPSRPLIHAAFRGQNANFRCAAFVDDTDDLVQVVTFMPVVVPADKLGAAAELCALLSNALKMGRFELDYDTGAVRFHTSSAFPMANLKEEVFQRVLGVNLVMVDLHLAAFIRVIYGGVAPAKAASQLRPSLPARRGMTPQPEIQIPSRLIFN